MWHQDHCPDILVKKKTVTRLIWKSTTVACFLWHLLCCCLILAVGFGSWSGVLFLLWPDIISPQGQSEISQLNNSPANETIAEPQTLFLKLFQYLNYLRHACFTILAGWFQFNRYYFFLMIGETAVSRQSVFSILIRQKILCLNWKRAELSLAWQTC